ncbi:SixA phosphatase family protein [Aequorivita capsosiphonis]|uniref:SixA phosphatase family protein n=1 Tax=Aequorivita capsosiphonis TaxID=487317 RepID=UPI0006882750|nr:phosphoglycerate mutase family protein [Aequorivita capsosiphonis]
MKHLILILTLLPIFTFCGQKIENAKPQIDNSESKTSEAIDIASTPSFHATYYLIRHAEKDRADPKNQDPSLNSAGMERTKVWTAYFEPIKLDEIFETKYIRTKQTVSLIAEQKMITPKLYNPNTIYSEEFLKKTNGKKVLIVGHSNTIPYLANNLINEEKFTEMDDKDNATLFKVTIDGDDKKVETISVE